MKNWTIQKLVFLGVVVVLSLALGLGYYTTQHLIEIRDQAVALQKAEMEELFEASRLQTQVNTNIARLTQLLMMSDRNERLKLVEAISRSTKENSNVIKELEAKAVVSEEKSMLNAIIEKRTSHIELRERIFESIRSGNLEEAKALYSGDFLPSQDQYLLSLTDFLRYRKGKADKALSAIIEATEETKSVNYTVMLASVFATILIGGGIIRGISLALKKLMMALIQVNSTSRGMSATLKEQQISANEVASTSVEIGATAKEISATTMELGKTMADVALVAEKTAAIAEGGQAGLVRLEGTMTQIMGATSGISAKLAILSDKTANINSMVTTINKVADQTNLLSLNAAIEAEKAGEFGHGFSVVATEIRRLADQTAVATYDIEQMVKEMQSAVTAGVMGMDKFAEEVRRGNEEVCKVTANLVQIIQQVQALTPRFDAVNEGMQSQTMAAGQISDALVQLGETAQLSAQAFRQNTEAVEDLSKAAQGLQEAASRFKATE